MHERDLHREGTSTIRSMSLRGPCGRKVPNSRKRCLGRACEKAEPQQVLCPSHCETAAGKMPKRRCWNPLSKIYAQTMRNRSQKTAETLLLEPTKNAEKRKMPKRCFWNLLKTKKKGCLKQGKPLRNVRLGSLQATRPNSRKRCLGRACEKAEPQQVLCPSHCETAAGKMPKRRFWNPLKRKKYSAQTMRNRSQKTAETLLLEPTDINKNKEKACKPPGQTQEKGVWDAHPKPLRNRSQKNAKTSLLEPTKKKKEVKK